MLGTLKAPPVPMRGAPGAESMWHALQGMRGLGGYKGAPAGSAPTPNFYNPNPGGKPLWYPVFPNAGTPALVPGSDGGVYLNPAKDAEHWFWLAGVGLGNVWPVASLPAGTSTTVTFTPPAEDSTQGDYEIVGMMGTWSPASTGRFAVKFNATGLDTLLTPTIGVANNLLFGTAIAPFIWFESILVQANQPLVATLTQLSGGTISNIALMAIGRRFIEYNEEIQVKRRERFARRRTHPVFIAPDEGSAFSVGASTAATLHYSVPSHADFECWGSMDDSDGAYNAQFFEGLSSRAMSDQASVDATSFLFSPTVAITGWPTGIVRACQFPHNWLYTHLFKRNSKIVCKITDTSGQTNLIRNVLYGRLVYYGLPSGCAPTGSRASLDPTVAAMNPYGGGTDRNASPFMTQRELTAERFKC